MDGLIIVNKEVGITSHDVVNKVRRIFNTRQVGHLGTLDPLATGVLVVCINEATKLVPYLENVSKEYVCEITMGISSDTYDISGNVLKRVKNFNISEEKIDEILKSFLGDSLQTPPLYSAIKIKGKKLYEYARKNESVELPLRKIHVDAIERISPLCYEGEVAKFSFKTTVSRGTYIRSICNDFGEKIGIPCLMSNLERTRNGEFTISMAQTLDEIASGNYKPISMLEALSSYPVIDNFHCINKATNGMKISSLVIKELLGYFPKSIVIKDKDKLVAIYILDLEAHCYKAGRVWR